MNFKTNKSLKAILVGLLSGSVVLLFSFSMTFLACFEKHTEAKTLNRSPLPKEKRLIKTNAEWKKLLSPQEFEILRNKGTERPFTGRLLHNKKKGIYVCAACRNELFSSKTKFDSKTGWPSFYQPISKNSLYELIDHSYGMTRRELVCARCDGHLGHVFEDGPEPTGLRYCINSLSLRFIAE